MGISNRYATLLTALVLVIFVSCDADKYLDSNLDVNPGLDSTNVTGTIYRLDTGEPVENALIQFGYNSDVTNQYGRFDIGIRFTQDDNRNLLSPIIIKADKYIEYLDYEYILPVPQEFSFNIAWAPPILLERALLFDPEGGDRKLMQVKVRDYEGIDNVNEVFVTFTFEESIAEAEETIAIPLTLAAEIDSLTGYFQSDFFSRVILHPHNKINYPITLTDRSGYIDSTEGEYLFLFPDSPLFPPLWDANKK